MIIENKRKLAHSIIEICSYPRRCGMKDYDYVIFDRTGHNKVKGRVEDYDADPCGEQTFACFPVTDIFKPASNLNELLFELDILETTFNDLEV